MKSNEFITERGRNGSDEFAVDPNAKPAEIPAWLKKAGTWLGNKIGLKEPVALPDYTASNQQDAASRSGYTGIDPVQRANAGMAPATQQEINRYMRDNPAVVGGLTDRNGNPIASGGAQEVERAARAAAPRRGADFDVDAEVGAVDPAVIGNRFKTPRELGFQPGGSTASAAEKSDDITLDKIKAAAGIPAAATPEVEIGAPIPARSLKTNTQPAVKKSFDEPVAAAPAPMKGGYGSGMNNPLAAATNETAELDRILKLSGMELIAEGSTKSITVQRGDTLSRIAQNNSTTVAAIVKLNNIANPDRIYPGDVIKIPGGQGDPGGQAKRQGQPPAPDIDSTPDIDSDPDNISRVERAWLNMIAREESSDDYTAINYKARAALKKGTMQITGKPGQHPFDGQSGVTAAGRYQMLYNTWKTAAKLAGVDPADFSPENQDRAAIALAKNEYKRKYNRDLITDLQDPKRVDQAVRGSTGPWSVKAGGPGFSTQDYVSALSDIQAA